MTSPRGWKTKQKAQLKTIVSILFFAPMILDKEIVLLRITAKWDIFIFKRILFI
jgi:hypothetical protein